MNIKPGHTATLNGKITVASLIALLRKFPPNKAIAFGYSHDYAFPTQMSAHYHKPDDARLRPCVIINAELVRA